MFLQSTDKIVGRYSITKRDADTNVLEHYEFNNLIIPTVLAQASERGLIEVIGIGSGTEIPTENDGDLNAPISGQWSVAFVDTVSGYDEDTSQPTLSYNYYGLIPEGIAISNIREFAMFDTENVMFSRALLKVGEEQLTLSKGESEYIEIRYSVIFKLPQGVQPVKTMTINGQVIQVTSEAFSNASGIGRFDGGDMIDGIYINHSEIPALGDQFQPDDVDISAVTLSEQQIPGRQDVRYNSETLLEATEIYEIVVKSQLGWYSYRFSPALQLPRSAKWSLGFGVQWAITTGAFVKAPEMMTITSSEEVKIVPTIVVTDFDLGEPPADEPLTFIGLSTEENTSTTLRTHADVNLTAVSQFAGFITESQTYNVLLSDYYALSVFKVGDGYAQWLKTALLDEATVMQYDITYRGESTAAVTLSRADIEQQFHINGNDVYFSPVMGKFSATHHVLINTGAEQFEVKINKSGYFDNLLKTPFSMSMDFSNPVEQGTFSYDTIRIDNNLTTYFFSSSTAEVPNAAFGMGQMALHPDTIESRWTKMVNKGFASKVYLDLEGVIDVSLADIYNPTVGAETLMYYVNNNSVTYTFHPPGEPRDVFTALKLVNGSKLPASVSLTEPDSDTRINEISANQSFDILLTVPGVPLGTPLTVSSPVDVTEYNLTPLFPFQVPLTSETIRIRISRG